MNVDTFTAAPVRPALLLEIEGILKTDDSWETISAEEEWKRDVPLFTPQTGFCEHRDLRAEPLGWMSMNDDRVWSRAVEVSHGCDGVGKELRDRIIPMLSESRYLPVDIPVRAYAAGTPGAEDVRFSERIFWEDHRELPSTSVENLESLLLAECGCAVVSDTGCDDIILIFDFAREISGRFELDVSGPAGTIVDITYSEQLWKRRILIPDAGPNPEEYGFTDRYILRAGSQTVGTSLMERGFRFVQVAFRKRSGPLTIHGIAGVDRRYPFSAKGSFNCDDSLLNTIWIVCSETLAACTSDVFTDCPWRERSFWVNDLIVENITALQLFGDPRVSARSFDLLFSEVNPCGLVPGVCPCPRGTVQSDWLYLLPASLYMPIILRDFLFYSGDFETVRRYLGKIEAILDRFATYEDANGVITAPPDYWCFFDWSYEFNGFSLHGKQSSLLNFLYVIAMQAYAEIAKLCGVMIDDTIIRNRIVRTSNSTEDLFYDPEKKRLSEYIEEGRKSDLSSQLTHAMAILAGTARGHIKKDLLRELNNEDRLMPDFFLHYFIFKAQKIAGSQEDGLGRIRKYWGDVVRSGSPTIWESGIHMAGKQALNGVGSLCHGFAASPVSFMQTVILGITPLAPGFSEFLLDPSVFDLHFAEGRVPTPRGNIDVRWDLKDKFINVSLRVPEGCRAITRDMRNFPAGNHDFKISIDK